jgi:hypothetical protein
MFFAPSKDNLASAKAIDFYTKNIVGDMLISLMKSDSELLKKLFPKNQLDLKSWTTTAQLAAVAFIFTSLSNSDIRVFLTLYSSTAGMFKLPIVSP